MRYTTAGALAACMAVVAAFKDTSPYILLSTSNSPATLGGLSTKQLQSSPDVLQITKNFLKGCPSDVYVIISQPMISTEDLSLSKSVPRLRKTMSSHDIRTKISISEVLGDLSPQELQDYIVSQCGATPIFLDRSRVVEIPTRDSAGPLVIRADFEPLPRIVADRAAQLVDNDYRIQSILDAIPSQEFTFMYTTTPISDKAVYGPPSYEPVFMEPLHMDLKRSYNASPFSEDERDTRPLFEKYQFFTPGLFMALLVTFILLAILSVGINALGSLQVSYGAFDKEMGPAAQKKQM